MSTITLYANTTYIARGDYGNTKGTRVSLYAQGIAGEGICVEVRGDFETNHPETIRENFAAKLGMSVEDIAVAKSVSQLGVTCVKVDITR